MKCACVGGTYVVSVFNDKVQQSLSYVKTCDDMTAIWKDYLCKVIEYHPAEYNPHDYYNKGKGPAQYIGAGVSTHINAMQM